VHLQEDTKEKCEKDFGGVDAALLITPGTGGEMGPKYLGKTMIRFNDKAVMLHICIEMFSSNVVFACAP
jgi:hypothetical protein